MYILHDNNIYKWKYNKYLLYMRERKVNISVSLGMRHLEYLDKNSSNFSETIRELIEKEANKK